MKKKITSAFLAAVMAFGLVACGPAENPDAILYEYTPYEFSPEAMPREIAVDQDMYDAWEYVIDKAMGEGATFCGVPAYSMSKGYFRQETEKMGYEHRELTASVLTAKGNGYNIDISNYLNKEETAPAEEISVQIFGMDEDGFNGETLNEVNNTISLGRSQQVLGKSTREMFEYLEISDLMLEFIKYFGSSGKSGYGSSSGAQYSYLWYEGDTASYHVIYNEGYESFHKRETASISLIREENGHSQDISFSNVSGGPVCSVRYKESDSYSREHMENFATAAENWRTRESMVDLWVVTEKTENGTVTPVRFNMNTYLELDWGNRGQMKVPVFADNDADIEWSQAAKKLQENPDEKLVFVVTVDNHLLPSVMMEYHYADDSVVIKNDENTLAYKFERIA